MADLRPGRASVRVRTTLAAVVVVVLALAVSAVLLVTGLRRVLVDDVEAAAERRAEEVVAALERGDRPSLAVADDDEEWVQVLDAGGAVVAASPNVAADRPVVDPDEADGRSVRVRVDDDEERFRVVAEEADGGEVVVVGATLEDVGESTGAVASLLAVGAPVLLLVIGVVTWWVVGRALRPVDRIRREVDAITVAELDRRVPVPASRDEVARLAETMNRMLARLEEGQERQRRFVADASHELRSPVASLRAHAEVGTPELREVVVAESARMQALIDDLLLLARADEGTLQTARRPVDLDDLVFAEAGRLRSRTALRVDTSAVGAGRVLGDAAALARVLRNLGDNAARHAASTVALALSSRGGEVVLHVDDDGPGIPAADRDRVLERFVRLDEGRARDAGGAGLGLAIVREVVAAHGGDVTVGESPLGGARITVVLPDHDG